jgi:phosphate transport system substrate-binding protein
MKRSGTTLLISLALGAVLAITVGCNGGGGNAGGDKGTETTKTTGTTAAAPASPMAPPANLEGKLSVDGSSTVFKISQAMAEEFSAASPKLTIGVSESGTSGGFKKFVKGEIEICGASRAIEKEEVEAAKTAGVEFVEVPIAFDGLTVVIHKDNAFAEDLTVEELKKIWEPTSTIKNWKDVRAGFPDMPMNLFGPGPDSGTFDYFTEAIVGKKDSSRSDYTKSEDDNVLVTGVAGDKGGLGYFGYAYYVENRDKLKSVKVGGVAPTEDTIRDGSYKPLSRPLFLYVNKKAMERPEVKAFVEYYTNKGNKGLITESGYVAFPDEIYDAIAKRVAAGTTGTVFDGTQVGMSIADILKKETGN